MPLLQVEHLTKVYRMGDVEVHALRGVSASVEEGEFVAIMGASGSGKSTFMNVLGCLDQPSGGIYKLEGIDVSTLNRDELARIRNQKIGFIFQQFNLLSRTSALENVELPMMYNNTSNKERYEKAMEALNIVGLAERCHHFSNQLSGGQQQRVAIARALVNDPSIILADEPTGNLDSRTSVEVMGILQKLNEEKGITIVMVTHEKDIAQYTRRNLFFRDGKILFDKDVEDHLEASKILQSIPATLEEEMLSGEGI